MTDEPEEDARWQALLAAAQRGDLAALQGHFAQPEVLARVAELNEFHRRKRLRQPLSYAVYRHRLWFGSPHSGTELLGSSVIDHGQVEVFKWFFSPERVELWGETLSDLSKEIALRCLWTTSTTSLEMLDIVLHSHGFAELLSDDKQQEVLAALLDWATSRDGKDAMSLLLSHGADPNAESEAKYKTPCTVAVGLAQTVESVRLLVSHGARLDNKLLLMRLPGGRTDDVFFELIRQGADPNTSTEQHGSPLHNAATFGHTELVAFLIHEGFADVEARDRFGRTPLFLAAEAEGYLKKADLASMELLLECGANVHAEDNSRCTALHAAVLRLDIDAARVLLDRGANPNHRGGSRRTLLALVGRRRDSYRVEAMLDALLEYGADALLHHRDDYSLSSVLSFSVQGHAFVLQRPKYFMSDEDMSIRTTRANTGLIATGSPSCCVQDTLLLVSVQKSGTDARRTS